ncbi:MAG: allophanate hydrolase [Gammaproteobacteria bacterium]
MIDDLSIAGLHAAYAAGTLKPRALIARLRERIDATRQHNAWIHVLDDGALEPWLAALDGCTPADLPLYGVPFAIKDNIDLAGVPTTAGCPGYAYVPARSASVVARLLAAGALPLGKTNLDQFATGLVGTRSPYGPGRNAFDRAYVSGGSSAGSALAVALGLATFALGTDTAGSGRVPAAFNNLIGVKPTRGLVSTRGVVPACRSLDCVSVFALDAADARRVLDVAIGFDADDACARQAQAGAWAREAFVVGVPAALATADDAETTRAFERALGALERLGATVRKIDLTPMLAAARLLYEGPWVAERYHAIRDFIAARPAALHPVTRAIIEPAAQRTAVEAFDAQYTLQALKRDADVVLAGVDCIMTPTTPTIPRIDDEAREPLRLNALLGTYTNFMNLLDYAAVAVPAGFAASGLPYGVTLFGPAHSDDALLVYADRLHRAIGTPVGTTTRLPSPLPPRAPADAMSIVVCGAHLRGLPLNHQLTERGGRLVAATKTAPCYRLYALPGGPPRRPGLVRVADGGAAIEVEVWSLPAATLGSFLAGIPAPLAIGTVLLADGSQAKGFLCEAVGLDGAEDLTHHGGWRAALASRAE